MSSLEQKKKWDHGVYRTLRDGELENTLCINRILKDPKSHELVKRRWNKF